MVDQATPIAPDLRTTSFPPEFTPGARNAVTTCLRIQPNEKVILITDERCLTIAASIAAELDRIGCTWNSFVLESLAPRPLTKMPAPVLADMETSQVSIFAVSVQPNELNSRMQMTDVVNLRHHPLPSTIQLNRTTPVTIKNKALERAFWVYTHTAGHSDGFGEFAIGTNIGVEPLMGNIFKNEQFPRIHIAFFFNDTAPT